MTDWKEKFADCTKLTHTEQAQFWLNGFWEEGAEQYADTIWEICHMFIETQLGEPVRYGGRMKEFTEGSDLDELKSHVCMERMGETLSVIDLRKRLKALDIDNNKKMALIEYLLDKYKKTPQELVASPQPTVDPALIQAAMAAFEAAGEALFLAVSEKQAAKVAAVEAANRLAEAQAAAAEAADALDAANKAKALAEEAHAKQAAAEAEVQAAVDEITALETTKANKLAALQKKIDDPSTSTMKKGIAVNEKAQLESEDEMPLRKAKITQKAALKHLAVATAAAANVLNRANELKARSAKAKSEADAAEAMSNDAKVAADRAEKAAIAAQEAAEKAEAEAKQQLEDIKNSSGPPYGPIYWMERTFTEKKKFMK